MNCKSQKYITLFFPSGHGNESNNLIGSQRGLDFPVSDRGHSNARVSFFSMSFFLLRAWKKINEIFTGLGSVHIVKNCDLGLEMLQHFQALGHSFSLYGPPVWTSQPANNIYLLFHHCAILPYQSKITRKICHVVALQNRAKIRTEEKRENGLTKRTELCLVYVQSLKIQQVITLHFFHFKKSNKGNFNRFACVVYVFRARIMQSIRFKMDFEN